MSALSRRLVRVLLVPAITVFVLLVLLSLSSPPARASDDGGVPLETSPALNGHRGHCHDEGYVNGEMPATSTSPPAAPPASTPTPVPVESRGSTCWMALFAMFLGIPAAAGVLGLGWRLR